MRFALCIVALVGCSQPLPTSTNRAPDIVEPTPFCVWSVAAPDSIEGTESYATAGRGVDCVTPGGGEVFSVGFATRGWWFQLDALRSAITVGDPQPLDRAAASLLLVTGDGRSCWDWTGDIAVLADRGAGESWSVFVDATCADASGLRLAGQWSSAVKE